MRHAIELIDIFDAVDRDDRVGLGLGNQVQQATDFGLTDDLVGDQDIGDARAGHDFCFTNLGARDSERARVEQHLGDGRHLEALGVWSPANPRFAERARHALDIALHHRQVDQQRGGVDLPFREADIAVLAGHDLHKRSIERRPGRASRGAEYR